MTSFQNIISCEDLHLMLHSKDLVILDASIPPVGNMIAPKYSWPTLCIPDARRFDLNQDFSDPHSHLPHTMVSASHFQLSARALGINQQSQIVVYDDLGLFSAARAWYMFRAMGHENIAVLDGGLPHWLKQNKPINSAANVTEEESIKGPGNFVSQMQADFFCQWRDVQEQTYTQAALILDARANNRFIGVQPEPRAGVRSGHMPNAKNLPYTDLLRNGLLKPDEDLQQIFTDINPNQRPMVMSCGSGVTACVLALAANICGFAEIQVYDGSWSEWGSLPYTVVEVVNENN